MKQLYKFFLIAFSLITTVNFAFAESYQVQGVVLSDEGEPLTGAVVATDGDLPTAVVTGVDGRFAIVVDDSCTSLEVTYLGFASKVVQLTALTEYSITLSEDSVGLSEVVVVGYAVQRKESVVGAIGSISGDDILGNKGDTSLTNALDGLIPGVTLIQSSGEPGSSTSEILIRGKSSWVNNEPLVLVDGIERDFDDIDPNDVQSISVLKDASATAVFGVKGANGVILVTLKEGEKGSAKIKFSSSVSLRQPISTYDLLSTAETLSLYNEALANQGVYDPSLYYSQEVIDKYATQSDPYLYPDVDWADELLRDVAVTQKYNVSVSGGKDKVKYYNSLSYSREGDIFNSEEQEYYDPRYTYKRFNYVSNLVFDLTSTTKVKLALTGSSATKTASSYSSSDLMNDITNRSPSYIFPAYYEDGTMGDYLTTGTSNNPIALLNYSGATRTRTNKAYVDLIIDQDLGMITQGLSAGAKVSYNNVAVYKQTISNKFDSSLNVIRYYYYEADDGTIQREVYPDENYQLLVPTFGSESLNSYQRDFYYEASLKYNRGFNRHRVGALALFQRRVDYSNADFRLPTEDWVARVEYAYDGRYMLEASGSYNGSDKFAEGNRFGFFPAIAVGWMISRERFVKEHLPFIDEFKIRYSYGKVGSDFGASRWSYMTQYDSFGKLYLGTTTSSKTTYEEGVIGNEDTTWETAIKQNLGFEFSFFDRISGTLDLFDERREGILMQRITIPTWFGQDNPYANIGETKSHGYELAIQYNSSSKRSFRYSFGGNVSYSENRVVYADDPANQATYLDSAGKPIDTQYMLVGAGLYQDWDDIYMYSPSDWDQYDRRPGDIIYIDYDADGQITAQDVVPYGELTYPAFEYGFNGSVSYNKFSLSVRFTGAADVARSMSTNLYYAFNRSDALTASELNLSSWSPDNTSSTIPANRYNGSTHNTASSAGYVNSYTYTDSDYLRLKSVELSYTIRSKQLKKKVGVSQLRIYANGKDLWTWSVYDDRFDPVSESIRTYPLMKYYTMGVDMTF